MRESLWPSLFYALGARYKVPTTATTPPTRRISRPRKTRHLYVPPQRNGLAPVILGGGFSCRGQAFDAAPGLRPSPTPKGRFGSYDRKSQLLPGNLNELGRSTGNDALAAAAALVLALVQ